MKLTKYHYHVLMIKDMCQMMEFILWLIFIKIVLRVVKKFKKAVIKKKRLKKVVIKKKKLKKIVIIQKDCDNKKKIATKKEILTDDHKEVEIQKNSYR